MQATQLLVNAAELAERLAVSERHVWGLHSSGRLPRPVSLGRCRRWKLADIETWLDNGCPRVTRRTGASGERGSRFGSCFGSLSPSAESGTTAGGIHAATGERK